MGSDKIVKWLPLDVDALDDPKIMALVAALGLEGYGIYIMLIQSLAKEESEYKLPVNFLKHLAYRNHVSEEKVNAVLSAYELFQIEDNYFYSNSLLRRMERYENLRSINRKKAITRWKNVKEIIINNAAALPEHYHGNAEERRIEKNRIEKNRVEKSKVEKKKELITKSKDLDSSSILDNDILKLYEWIIKGKLPGTKESVFPERLLPKNEKQKSDWQQCIEKLLRLDKYSLQEINRSIIFAREDPFWSKTFLSLLKLRNKDKNGVKYIDRFISEYENSQKTKRTGTRSGVRVNALWAKEDPVDKMIRESMEIVNKTSGKNIPDVGKG